jgi:CRISPR/Cas system-associated exonuclease Cas4 (RecB family)
MKRGLEMFDFNKLVEKHIEREHKPKKIGRYYPSEIGGCLRKLWYSYNYPQKVSVELQKIFEVGNIVHGFVVEVLKSEKNKDVELLKEEFPFQIQLADFIVSGRVDDLVQLKENGKNVLVEVKSTKSLEFIQKAQKSHEMQLLFYMHVLKIHNGIVLYVDKNNLQSKTFEIPFDQKKAEQIVMRFNELHEGLTKRILPRPEAKESIESNWACAYCEYTEKCEKNEN